MVPLANGRLRKDFGMNARAFKVSAWAGLMLVVVLLDTPTPQAAAQGSGNSPAVEVQRAETFVAQGEFVQALAAARSALQQDPSSFRARYYASFSLLGLERFDEAGAEAEKALALAPDADRPMAEKLIAAIGLQRDSLTAEADAEAALAAGLNAKAARLYSQAYEADGARTEVALKAADLYAGSLDDVVSAGRLLNDLAKNAPTADARALAKARLDSLGPQLSPLVDSMIDEARWLIDNRRQAEGEARLAEIEALSSDHVDAILIERARVAALGNDAAALQSAITSVMSVGGNIDALLNRFPRGAYWATAPWLENLLADYKGVGFARAATANLAAWDLSQENTNTFRDCFVCPELVLLSAGSFTMGSPRGELYRVDDEGPQKTVRIQYPLAVGKYEVTCLEWDACVSDRGCPAAADDGFGKGRRPVTNVSWDDAKTYAKWLSGKTAETYRLLSEAEWEYAARAGTKTPFSFGATISTNQANYDGSQYDAGSKGQNRRMTTPVGSFPANEFGLYDMHGNALEWTEDCYQRRYASQPDDGSTYATDACIERVARGGFWLVSPAGLRSASRYYLAPESRSNVSGFRVSRTMQ